MNLNGQWWNPAYGGEGFYLTEQNGRLIGAFFTFDGGGAATWYVFDCNRTGDTYSGQVTQAEGGSMGSPLNSQHAYQVPVGSIIFVKDVGWSFEATIKGTTFGYALTKLFPIDSSVDPEPPYDPPVDQSPFDGKVTLRIKGFKRPGFGQPRSGPFDPNTAPLWSVAQLPWTSLPNGRSTVLEVEITAHEELSILNFGASGHGNPSIEDVPGFIPAGDTVVVSFDLSKDSRPNGHANADYQIDTQYGPLIVYTARILGGQ